MAGWPARGAAPHTRRAGVGRGRGGTRGTPALGGSSHHCGCCAFPHERGVVRHHRDERLGGGVVGRRGRPGRRWRGSGRRGGADRHVALHRHLERRGVADGDIVARGGRAGRGGGGGLGPGEGGGVSMYHASPFLGQQLLTDSSSGMRQTERNCSWTVNAKKVCHGTYAPKTPAQSDCCHLLPIPTFSSPSVYILKLQP